MKMGGKAAFLTLNIDFEIGLSFILRRSRRDFSDE
jgi:hypothetical protein